MTCHASKLTTHYAPHNISEVGK